MSPARSAGDHGPADRDAVLKRVRLLALLVASQDSGLKRRGDVSAEDIAQDVCAKYARLDPPPQRRMTHVMGSVPT